jgi:hypothetical protein
MEAEAEAVAGIWPVALLSQTADDFSRSLDVWRFIILALCAYFLFFRSDAAVLSRTTFPER